MNQSTINFKELLSLSGDSHLIKYNLTNSYLTIVIRLGEDEEKYKISANTKLVEINTPPLGASEVFYTCFLQSLRINDFLKVKNGFYVPATNFEKFMKERKTGLFLGYGLRMNPNIYLVTLKGYSNLISFVSENINDIDVKKL